MSPENPIRVLLVDDDVRLTVEVASALGSTPRVEIAGVAHLGADAIRLARTSLEFDIALVDLGLPDGSGVDVIRDLRRLRPSATAIAFTVFDDAPQIFAALRAGARGYLLKSTSRDELVAHLEEARQGGAPMSRSVARMVVNGFSDPAPEGLGLTPREREVLVLLAKGESYPRIALVLEIGHGTVQSHVKNIYEKLEVSSKAEAAAIAVKWGLV